MKKSFIFLFMVMFFLLPEKTLAGISTVFDASEFTLVYQFTAEREHYFTVVYGINKYTEMFLEIRKYTPQTKMNIVAFVIPLWRKFSFRLGVGSSNVNNEGGGLVLGTSWNQKTFVQPLNIYFNINYYNSVIVNERNYEAELGLYGEVRPELYLMIGATYLSSGNRASSAIIHSNYLKPFVGIAWCFEPEKLFEYH